MGHSQFVDLLTILSGIRYDIQSQQLCTHHLMCRPTILKVLRIQLQRTCEQQSLWETTVFVFSNTFIQYEYWVTLTSKANSTQSRLPAVIV